MKKSILKINDWKSIIPLIGKNEKIINKVLTIIFILVIGIKSFKVLNNVYKIPRGINLNNININQKKYKDLNNLCFLFLKSKSNDQIKEYEEGINKINQYSNNFLNEEEYNYFSNFEGNIILFKYIGLINGKEKEGIGISFYNYLNVDNDRVRCYLLSTIIDFSAIYDTIRIFLQDSKPTKLIDIDMFDLAKMSINYLNKYNNINLFIDDKKPFGFFEIRKCDDLLHHLKNMYFFLRDIEKKLK